MTVPAEWVGLAGKESPLGPGPLVVADGVPFTEVALDGCVHDLSGMAQAVSPGTRLVTKLHGWAGLRLGYAMIPAVLA